MSTQGHVGLNAQLKIGDGTSPENFNLIPECKDLNGPAIIPEFVDFTHQQTTGGFRERKPTFKSPGEITGSCNYIDNNTYQDQLINAAYANPPNLTNFQLVSPSGSTFSCAAYVAINGWSHPLNGPIEMSFTLSLDGAFHTLP